MLEIGGQLFENNIVYFGANAIIQCDRICRKAWGRNNRPVDLQGNFLGDMILGLAPDDPGTYEGRDGKPTQRNLTKWCVRQCERSKILEPNEALYPSNLPTDQFGWRPML